MDIDRYKKLKADVDRSRRDADRAEGAFNQLMARLKKEFGCDTLEQAEVELAKRKKERDESGERFTEKLADFEETYGEMLK